jgi:hypothetical protein
MTIAEQRALFFSKTKPFALNPKERYTPLARNIGRMNLKQLVIAEEYSLSASADNCQLFEAVHPGSGILEYKFADESKPHIDHFL